MPILLTSISPRGGGESQWNIIQLHMLYIISDFKRKVWTCTSRSLAWHSTIWTIPVQWTLHVYGTCVSWKQRCARRLVCDTSCRQLTGELTSSSFTYYEYKSFFVKSFRNTLIYLFTTKFLSFYFSPLITRLSFETGLLNHSVYHFFLLNCNRY